MINKIKKGLDWFVCGITSEKEISSRNRRLLALLFTIAAIVFGCIRYTRGGWGDFYQFMVWPVPVLPNKLDFFSPGFLHAFLGLLLCAPLYIREFLPFKSRSPYYYLTLGLNIWFFAVIAQLVLGEKASFEYNLSNTLIIAALVLTWLGIRTVAGFAWIIVFGIVAYNLLDADMKMKDFGIWFLICGFFSLIFQSDLTPKEMFKTFKEEFRGISQSPKTDIVKQNINDAIDASGRLVTNAAGVAK